MRISIEAKVISAAFLAYFSSLGKLKVSLLSIQALNKTKHHQLLSVIQLSVLVLQFMRFQVLITKHENRDAHEPRPLAFLQAIKCPRAGTVGISDACPGWSCAFTWLCSKQINPISRKLRLRRDRGGKWEWEY